MDIASPVRHQGSVPGSWFYRDAPIGYVTLDPGGRIVDLNDRAADVLGRRQTLLGRAFVARARKTYQFEVRDFLAAVMEERQPDPLTVPLRGTNARTARVELHGRAIGIGAERRIHIAVIDVTYRHQAEEALRESETRNRMIVEAMNEGLAIFDDGRRFVFVNRRLARLLGRSEKSLTGKRAETFMTEGGAARFRSKWREIAGGLDHSFEISWRGAGGRTMHSLVSPRPILGPVEEMTGLLVVVTDLTPLKMAERNLLTRSDELDASRTEKEQYELLAYMASHDLRVPVRTILNYVDLARAGTGGDEGGDATRDALRRIRSAAEKMRRLLDDLQDLARAVTSREVLTNEVDLNREISDVIDGFSETISGKSAKVEVGPMPVIRGNAPEIRQLFQNLIGNALKFTADSAPFVEVSAGVAQDGFLRIAVRDNGAGFDASEAPAIFEPFKRGAGSEKYPGSGVGLAICRRIAERHGGRLIAESLPGRGSAFYFDLPQGKVITIKENKP